MPAFSLHATSYSALGTACTRYWVIQKTWFQADPDRASLALTSPDPAGLVVLGDSFW
jgi:hypothetical protein